MENQAGRRAWRSGAAMDRKNSAALDRMNSSRIDENTPSTMEPMVIRPAPRTQTFTVKAESAADHVVQMAPGTPRPAKTHKKTLSIVPDPLPKTDPYRKETGWNPSGCLVYLIFLAAYVFYFYVRIRYTLGGGILWYSILILVFEFLASSSMIIHGLSLLRKRIPRKLSGPVPIPPFIVRVLIPCYTESLDIVSKTVLAAANATLPEKSRRTVYVLDDGKDTAKAAWVAEQNRADIVYISGRVRQKGETNGKACNLNNTLAQLYPPGTEVDESEVVVVFDADMVCYPDFFVKILAELYDPQVAIVLTPQKFWNYDINCDIFNHSNLIYWQVSLPGLDGWDNVSCTGTNFVVRAKAAQEARWFPTYTLGEDMALALEIQKEGWKGAYVQEYLAVGEVPETVRNAFMQKSRWCKGGMQIFLSKHNAMFAPHLSLMQRLVWNTSGWSYVCTTVTTPVFLVIPVIGVWAGYFPLEFTRMFALAFSIYSPASYMLLYYCHDWRHIKSIYFSIVAAHMFWFAYTKATFNTIIATIFNRTIRFKTTEKSVMATTVTDLANKAKKLGRQNNFLRACWMQIQDIWVHLIVFLVCLASIVVAIIRLCSSVDVHSVRSLSMMVSIGWLVYNMIAPMMLLWHFAFGKRFLGGVCTFMGFLSTAIIVAIIILIWMVLPNEYNYTSLLGDSLDFYAAQKSGILPADNPIPWRGNSALTDRAPNGASLVGGYYDDGGFVKNSFSLAATAALLAWGMLEFPAGFTPNNMTAISMDRLKWGTDYLLACSLAPNSTNSNGYAYVAQVGSYAIDATYWGRPEDMTLQRPAYEITQAAPGSDLLASTAAALAAASMVFQPTNQTYATQLVSTAEALYGNATRYLGKYSDAVPAAQPYYNSSSYLDDLAWGATWLYTATKEEAYLTDALAWYSAAVNNTNASLAIAEPNAFNWDNKLPGAAVLLAQNTGFKNATIMAEVNSFFNAWIHADGGVQRANNYLSYVGPEGALRNVANAGFLAWVYQQNSGASGLYKCWAEYQARILLGDSDHSYVVGTGHNGPLRPDSEAASCAGNYTTPCPTNAETNPAPNPWTITGALVSGPQAYNDLTWVDSRLANSSRITIEYNAGFTGLLAALAIQDQATYTHCSQGQGFIHQLSNPSPI